MTMTARVTLSLLMAATATTAMAHEGPDFPGKDDGTARTFSVPIDIGTAGFTPGFVHAKLALKRPAILESCQGFCQGSVNYGFLNADEGPRGANGTTVAPLDAASAADLRTYPLHAQFLLDFKKDEASGTFPYATLPSTHLGVPVKAEVDIDLFPNSGQDIRCQMVLIFKLID